MKHLPVSDLSEKPASLACGTISLVLVNKPHAGEDAVVIASWTSLNHIKLM